MRRIAPLPIVMLLVLPLMSGCASEASRTLAPYKQSAKEQNSAASWYEYGAAALAVEEYKTARKALERCLELEPENLDAMMKLGQAYEGLQREYGTGYMMYVTHCYRDALKIDPDHREALVALGEADLNQILAFEVLGQINILYLSPTLSDMQMIYLDEWDINLEQMIGIYQECLDIWRKMVKAEETNAVFWANLGVIANLTNNMDGSRVSFLEALELDPDVLADKDLHKEIFDATMMGEKWVPTRRQ